MALGAGYGHRMMIPRKATKAALFLFQQIVPCKKIGLGYTEGLSAGFLLQLFIMFAGFGIRHRPLCIMDRLVEALGVCLLCFAPFDPGHVGGLHDGLLAVHPRYDSFPILPLISGRCGKRLKSIEIRYSHHSQKRIDQALNQLEYHVPNSSAIERCNATTRSMSKTQVCRSLTLAKREDQKMALGWWNLTAYNWSRSHCSLRHPLLQSQDIKSISNIPRLRLSVWLIKSFRKLRSSFPHYIQRKVVEINSQDNQTRIIV
jgi:hypothetical protein